MKRILIALIAGLVLFTPPPLKARPKVSADIDLATAEFKATNSELNRVYEKCLTAKTGTPQGAGALRDAQRLWTVYRDLNARAFQYNKSGRFPKDDHNFYKARTIVTLNRIKELHALFGCN